MHEELSDTLNDSPTLTVFTPAYNRAHTITRTYESLIRQTSKDFEWLIIDDGSTDNTRQLVTSWLDNKVIDGDSISGYSHRAPWLRIRYIYQQNQGMHGAHNTAYDHIDTELNTCIDSDDFMPDDAVRAIVDFWHSQSSEKKLQYAGIIGLDVDVEKQNIIGTSFPSGLISTTLSGYYRNGGRGDKKLVYRTEIIKQAPPYPLFESERYVGLNYKYLIIDRHYELLVLNQPLVIVDYQVDGSSSGMFKQYWNNPKGWAFYRKFEMRQPNSLRRRLIINIHYVSSSIIANNRNFISESPNKLLTVLTLLPGYLLFRKIRKAVFLGTTMKITTK